MSGNIRLRGKHYYYDFMIDGKRYKGTTKTGDKKLAEHIPRVPHHPCGFLWRARRRGAGGDGVAALSPAGRCHHGDRLAARLGRIAQSGGGRHRALAGQDVGARASRIAL